MTLCTLSQERRGEGTHDGTFKEENLFECDPCCAVYVSIDKLTQQRPVDAAVVKAEPTFALGDKVIVVDKNGNKVKGKVRWNGKHNEIEVLGIEAVSKHY